MSRTAALLPAFSVFLSLSVAGAQAQTSQPTVQGPVHFDVSPPLRDMPASTGVRANKRVIVVRHPGSVPGTPTIVHDPARQTLAGPLVNTTGGLNFDALANIDLVDPPDTNMAVSPTYILQWVNLSYAVYDKSGNILPGYPKEGNTIWSGFGGACDPTNSASNGGDIIAQYDKANGRFVLSQLADTGGPTYYHCIAVSTSGDPTGTYNRYAYSFGNNLPDYPKMTIWPDAYYASYNLFAGGSTFVGAEACAYDGAAMRAGAANPKQICFQTGSDPYADASLLPSDLDGATPPPAGSPNFYLNFSYNGSTGNGSTLGLWKFHVDFATPASSTFTGPTNITVSPFNIACGGGSCIPQQGFIFNTALDSLGDRLMYRLAYRNFGDHEALVVNHSVTSGSVVGVRWYEIRSPNGTPTVFQQGTFDPGDGNFRWMGSAAMDHAGDIAIGYSVSSNNLYPSISYTGRTPADPLNTLETEASIVVGGSTQFFQNRWGDYSDMVIDPTDDCTFWYTTEYMESGSYWQTRIASFKFSNCGQNLTGTTTSVSSSANPSTQGQSVSFTATVSPSAATGTVQFSIDGSPFGSPVAVSGGTATSTSTTTLSVGTHSVTASYSGDSTYAGSTSTTLTQTVKGNTTTTVASSLNPSGVGQSVSFTATVSPAAATGTVQFSIDDSPFGSPVALSGGTATSGSTSTLTAGGHTVTATYNGSSIYNSSTSPPLTQTVKAATTTTVSSSLNPSTQGQSVSFTATVSPSAATGTVQFSIDGSPFGSPVAVSGGTATSTSTTTLSVGTHSVTASYSGDSTYAGSTSTTLTQTVNPPPPAAPVLTVGSATKNSLTLNWTEATPPPVTSFDILRCTGSSCTPSTVIASGLSSTTRSYKNSGLSRRTTYRYQVRANNSGGPTLSNVAQGTTN